MKAKIKRLLGISMLWFGGFLLPFLLLDYLIICAFTSHYPYLAYPVFLYISSVNCLAFGAIFGLPFKHLIVDRFFPDLQKLERIRKLDLELTRDMDNLFKSLHAIDQNDLMRITNERTRI